MKTRLIIIIGIVSVLTFIVSISVVSPSINNFDDFIYQLKEPFDGAEQEEIVEPEPSHVSSRLKIEGKMADQICMVTGGECPLYYIGNIQEDGSVMIGITISDTVKEKQFIFFIKNDTLSYEIRENED